LNDFLNWPYLQQVFRPGRRFLFTKTGEIQKQVVYGITSLSREEITSKNLLKKIRAYWGIENGLPQQSRDRTGVYENQVRLSFACQTLFRRPPCPCFRAHRPTLRKLYGLETW